MSHDSDLQRFQELIEASASRELSETEIAFVGRMGYQSSECRDWLEEDSTHVDELIHQDDLAQVTSPSSLDWARVDTGLRRAGALPTPDSKMKRGFPLLATAAALLICTSVIYSILEDGLSKNTSLNPDEVVFEVLDLPEGDGSFILHEEEGDDDGVLMIIFSNG